MVPDCGKPPHDEPKNEPCLLATWHLRLPLSGNPYSTLNRIRMESQRVQSLRSKLSPLNTINCALHPSKPKAGQWTLTVARIIWPPYYSTADTRKPSSPYCTTKKMNSPCVRYLGSYRIYVVLRSFHFLFHSLLPSPASK